MSINSKVFSTYQLGDGVELHVFDKTGWYPYVLFHRKLFDADPERYEQFKSTLTAI